MEIFDDKEEQCWSKIPAGKVSLGVKTNPRQDFNWDNEGPPQVFKNSQNHVHDERKMASLHV